MRPRPAEREPFFHFLFIQWGEVANRNVFPYTIPSIAKLTTLKLHPAVTILIGENGSGKSTLLEAMAVRLDFDEETGGDANKRLDLRPVDGGLHDVLRLHSSIYRRPGDRFFMRAETAYNYASHIDREAMQDGYFLARYGGRSLHARSHGEAFMEIVRNRLKAESFFIMDEPEAALSPTRQIAMLKEMVWLVRSGCQFVIATHSPILMAYPDSLIYELSDDGIHPIEYEETEHYKLTARS